MNAKQHKQECLKHGFLDSVLSESDMKAIFNAGLDEKDAYGIECDLQCEAFETLDEALEYYKRRPSED
jgi:hypothetical protein